jgi:PAS domain S-box-containing protein
MKFRIAPALGGTVLAIVLLVVGASLWGFRHTENASDSRRHAVSVMQGAAALLAALADAESGQRGYVLTGDEAFLQPYLQVRDGIDGRVQGLREMTGSGAALAHLNALAPLIETKMAELERVIVLRRKRDMPAVLAMVREGEGRRLMDAIRTEVRAFIQVEDEARAMHEAEYESGMRALFTIIVTASLLALLLTIAFVYLLYRETQHRLTRHVISETKGLLQKQEESNRALQISSDIAQVSEERLAVTLHSIGDAVIATDGQGRVTLLNSLAEKLTGWTQAEAVGLPVDDIFHIISQDTRQPVTIPVKATLERGTIHGLANHTVLICRDGSEYAIADSCAPIRDRAGVVVGAVLVFRDVSAVYAGQQALQDSTQLVQTILNNVVDGIITLDEAGDVVETANPAAERMFGYGKAEYVGRSFGGLLDERGRDRLKEMFQAAHAAGDSGDKALVDGHGLEVVGLRKDGSSFPLEMAVSEMWLGGLRHFTAILRDLTERKRGEDALLKAGGLQSAIFNSANFSSIATDAKGVIQIFNVGAERMLGYSAAEVMNKITPADISDPREVITRAAALSEELGTPITPGFEALVFKASRGIEDIYELTYIRKDGSRFPAVVSVTALRDAQDAIIGYLLIGTDNTARKQAEEALLKAGALQSAIFNSANFSSIATDAKGVIQIFNVGAERMLGYTAAEVMNKITPADISDPREVITRAAALSAELGTSITPGFEALVFKASRGIEDIYELTYIRKDGSRFPAVVSVTALRDAQDAIIGYLLIGTDNTARKQAEEALLKAGALQSAIFNSANFSSIATDAEGVIQIFNVGAERMLGYTAAEVMNKITPADISDPNEVITRAEALSAELGTPITPGFEALVFKASRGIEDIYELTYIRKDGSRFPAVVSVTALRDAQDAIIGYLLIGTDNTARKQAEEALLKAGALQSAIFNSANFSSIATDAKGVIQIFNVGAERMLGYTAAEVMNKITPADISDPQEVIVRAEALSAELGTSITPGFEALVFKASRGIEDIYELTYIRKDGSRFPAVVSVTALRDAQDAIIGYLLIGTDNTARKQIEAEQTQLAQRLRDQQFYTRSLFESNIDALMTTDPSGIITDVNKQMEALTGCTRDELIGAPFKNYFTDPERAETSIKRVLSGKKVTNFELTAHSRDGKETVVSYNATTFYDRDRKLQGVFAAARDVTERKRLDQVLQEKNVELEAARLVAEKANLAKSDFLSSMSHELRSPLNAILGFAQLMESEAPAPTPTQSESIAQILQAGWHLLKLINEILDLAKVESRQVPLSEEPVSMAEVLLECQAMIDPQAQQRGIRLMFPHFDKPHFVHADRTRLKQILINLLTNAIKYNSEKGMVTVTCAARTPERFRISIRDAGAGLSPEHVAQLFQPFNRLGQEAGGEEGTGIGLVVAKRLVELMGGAIGVESTVGRGSTFWFELNSAQEPRLVIEDGAAAPLLRTAVPGELRHHSVLYVEDNPANMKLVQQIIARHPELELLTAVNGTLGIELARAHLPDVILMDINLPGIDGFEAMHILHGDPLTEHIPVIAISANAMPLDIESGIKAGFFRYITKPIKVTEFMDALRLALDAADAGQSVRETGAVGMAGEASARAA